MRSLRNSPTFSVVAVFTLAVGISANTTIFSLSDLIIRRPVALPEIERLVVVTERSMGSEDEGISPANYQDLRLASKSFDRLAAYNYWSANGSVRGEAEEVHGVKVTPNFFSTVGLNAARGRTFSEVDSSLNNNEVVISDALWKQRFGAEPNTVGQKLELNGEFYTVIGVLPDEATFPLGAPAFWIPLVMDSKTQTERNELDLHAVGRLRPGLSMEQARAEIESLWRQLTDLYPKANRNRSVQVVSLRDHIVLDYNRQFALLLSGAVGFVLLIICANMATLQLARGARKRQEIAIRTALGASRLRLFRQLLLESLLLAVLGGVLGGMLAVYGTAILRHTLPDDVRWFCDVESLRVSLTGLLFTSVIALGAGVLTGLAPAWQHSKIEIGSALVEGGERVVGRRKHLWRGLFVITEVALALVLLVGATLMVKGFRVLAAGQVGLSPSSLLTFHLTLPESRYPQLEKIVQFQDQVLQQLSVLPGVESAAIASGVPYSFYEDNSDLIIPDASPSQSGQGPVAMAEAISSDYFRTMRIPVREGREFSVSDTGNSLPVCIVSQSTAQRLWPGQDAIGKQLKVLSDKSGADWIAVVGVVGDIQHEIYDRSYRSILYRPYRQAPPRSLDFAIRAKNPLKLVAAVRSEMRKLDRDLPVENVESMSELIVSQASGLHYVALLMAGLGALALILAGVGVYGVMANSVTESWREIAIRMALGARAERLLLTVTVRAMFYSTIGVIFGLGLAFSLARLLSSLIYGVSAWDAPTFLVVPASLFAIAFLACYWPARRATRMDPMMTLRCQ